MKLAVFSDLHTEFDDEDAMWVPPATDADVIVFAGDVVVGLSHLDLYAGRVEQANPSVERFIYVAGNHEWYGSNVRFGDSGYEKYRSELRKHPRSVLLELDTVQVRDYTFSGCTLWSNPSANDTPYLRDNVNDYSQIRLDVPPYRRLRPADVSRRWRRSVSFLRRCEAETDPSKLIVVTHHSPTFMGLERHQDDDRLMDTYASNLDDLIQRWQPLLWLHGHVHQALDRRIGRTRILCNPRGYNTPAGDDLVQGFNPNIVLET